MFRGEFPWALSWNCRENRSRKASSFISFQLLWQNFILHARNAHVKLSLFGQWNVLNFNLDQLESGKSCWQHFGQIEQNPVFLRVFPASSLEFCYCKKQIDKFFCPIGGAPVSRLQCWSEQTVFPGALFLLFVSPPSPLPLRRFLPAVLFTAAPRSAPGSPRMSTRRLQAQNEANTRRRQQRVAVIEERRSQKQQYLLNRGWANPETPPFPCEIKLGIPRNS